jgi:carbamoylphosphate synthase large subunit
MNYVIILGGSRSTYPFLLAVKEMGYRIILVDANPNSYCSSYSEISIPISTFNGMEVWKNISEHHVGISVVGVLCYSSYREALLSASFLSKKYKVKGFSAQSVINVYDKQIMNSLLNKYEILTPQKYDISSPDCAEQIRYPCIIKPTNGIGSRGVQLVSNEKDLVQQLTNYDLDINEVICEQFIEGELYHADGFISNAKAQIFSVVKKGVLFQNKIPLTESYSPTPIYLDTDMKDRIDSIIKNSVKATEIDNNYFGVDFIISKQTQEIYTLEIGYLMDARIDRLLYHSSVNVYKMFVDIVLGNIILSEDYEIANMGRKSLKFFYANNNGRISIKDVPDGIIEWEVENGQRVNVPSSISHILGWHIYDSDNNKIIDYEKLYEITQV